MPGSPPEEVTPFVFSDPTGKRWPRLRLISAHRAACCFSWRRSLFVQTLFVAPKMNVPFSLRQLKGQLKALQKQNPADQLSPSFAAVAEIYRSATGGEKACRRSASAYCATAEEIA